MKTPKYAVIAQRTLRTLKYLREAERLLTLELEEMWKAGATVEPGELGFGAGGLLCGKAGSC